MSENDLGRFLSAQRGSYDTALAELRRGQKLSHWMWWIFPQLAGLGRSERARYFGLSELAEARAYLADPVLGHRLGECVDAMLSHEHLTAREILGSVDAMKFRSSATLFEAAGGGSRYAEALERFYDGERCEATLQKIVGQDHPTR